MGFLGTVSDKRIYKTFENSNAYAQRIFSIENVVGIIFFNLHEKLANPDKEILSSSSILSVTIEKKKNYVNKYSNEPKKLANAECV